MAIPLPADASDPVGATALGHRRPAWLDEPALTGRLRDLKMRILGSDVRVQIWSPGPGKLPMLIAHDGPEYDSRAALTRYAGAMIRRGVLPPFRVALVPPGTRDEWYSASATYGRALRSRILPSLCDQIDVTDRPVGMGASLGALAMLQAQRSWPGTLAGLFLQSGSFYIPRFDGHESGFPRFGRIVRFVDGVLRATDGDPVPVVMTCGAEEENLRNNRLMVAALAAQGYPARLHEVPFWHDFKSWRNALHPHLTGLLVRLWAGR